MKRRLLELAHLTLAQVEDLYNWGSVSQAEYEAYCRVWDWSAPRFGGAIGLKHEAYWNKYGKERYYARIDKVRRAFGWDEIGHKPEPLTP